MQSIHLILLHKSIGVHYLIILFSKHLFDVKLWFTVWLEAGELNNQSL